MIAQCRVRECHAFQIKSVCSFVVLHCAGIVLDPRNEAASFSIANVNVADTTGLQESLHRALNLFCGGAFASDDPAIFSVGF